MADLLPSTPDTSAATEADPRVVGLDDDETGEVLGAIASDTARELLAALHDDSDTPSGLADRIDTSLQNAQYHLGRMEKAGLVEVIDTIYSEKGREMSVYAPADRPLVVFAGDGDEEGLWTALRNLLGGLVGVALVSLVADWLLTERPWVAAGSAYDTAADLDGSAGRGTAVEAAEATGQAVGLPPGVVFLLGGVVGLVVMFGVQRLWW